MIGQQTFPIAALMAMLLAPLVTAGGASETKLVVANGSVGDNSGSAVSASDDVIVVGASGDDIGGSDSQGSATVFRWEGSSWIEEQLLTASNGSEGDGFGYAISVSDQVIVVGAPYDNVGPSAAEGSATVYRWDGSSWGEEQWLSSSTGAPADIFGTSVSTSNGVIVIGVPYSNIGIVENFGLVWVYRWNGSSWIVDAGLRASNGQGGDEFGRSVSVDDDVIVVGSPGDDISGKANQGSATVFRWDGVRWVEEQVLTASGGETMDSFGYAVAVSGNVIVVGARWDDVGGISSGSATVFRWDGSSWIEEQQLRPGDGANNDLFGAAVSVRGGLIVIGALFDDVGGSNNMGSATGFRWNGTNWDQEQQFIASDGAAMDSFGGSVAVGRETFIVGSLSHDSGGVVDQGATYVYDVSLWSDQGFSLAGISGAPLLAGSGPLSEGSANSVDLSGAAPMATAGLFIALSSTPVPFKGGTLVAFPFLTPIFLTTSPSGSISVPFVMPSGVPVGTELWLQWGIQDAAAAAGVALSNAILGVIP